ncbi:hypothetical protein EPO15_02115 [bacterium]|nr:MAG: hypothetical protein EPO15_02115 [bacterium]
MHPPYGRVAPRYMVVEVVMNIRISKLAALALVGAFAATARAEARAEFDNAGGSVRELVLGARQSAKDDKTAAPEAVQVSASANDQVERRIVVFDKSTSRSHRLSSVRNLGGTPTADLWLINAVAVMSPKSAVRPMDARLAATQGVLRVEKDYVQNWLVGAPAAQLPPALKALPPAALDAPAPEPQGQQTPWGIDRVNAKKAWAVTRGAGVKVAVVDTGVDFDHPDLKVAGGFNTIDNAKSFKDDNGHGSHVAGTIAAQDNDQGVVGIAPDVTLYGVKVLSAEGGGTFEDVIEGIQWAVENRMDIANFSLGASQGTPALQDAVKAAAAAGTAIIAAAGNSGRAVGYPAAYPETIAVAASDASDKVAYFSSRGPEVDIIAPGVNVQSTYMGGGYDSLSGTSMATPHVVGLAALAVAAKGVHGPEAIRAELTRAARKFPNVPAEQQGAGMVDAGELVKR